MKRAIRWSALWYVVLLLLSTSILFSQDVRDPGHRESLAKTESLRYKTSFLSAQAPSDPRYDALYYKLDITITTAPKPNYLTGYVVMRAKSLRDGLTVISLDLMNSMTVDSVRCGGTPVSFTQFSHYFDIQLDQAYGTGDIFEVIVYYRGLPGSSGFGSFAFLSHLGTPWVWSLSEPNGAKDWWPCKDHPSDKADSADILITCSSSFKAGSNGRLIQVTDNGNSTRTYHWQTRYPISAYLISVTLTNFSEFTNWWKYQPGDSMPVLNYVLPEHLSSAQSSLPKTIGMLNVFSNMFGRYPFVNEKYGHCEFGWGGAMEHQTMTSTGTFNEFTIAHELAHQWFGDMITCRTWGHLWLNEGFATYCESLYAEALYGKAAFWSNVINDMNAAKNATGTLFLTDSSNVNYMFNYNRVYAKGATVLHMLRRVLGDSVFFDAMYNYANDPDLKFGTATTLDFQEVCEETSGRDLDYFFNEWIYGQGFPNYTYWYRTDPASGGGHKVTIGVNQSIRTNPAYFTMPIDIKLTASGWDTSFTVFNDQALQTFSVVVSHQPVSVLFDSAGWIMKSAAQISPPPDTTSGIKYAQLSLGALASPVVSRVRFAVGADSVLTAVHLEVNGQALSMQKSGDLFFGDYDVANSSDLTVEATATDIHAFSVSLNKHYLVFGMDKPAAFGPYRVSAEGNGFMLLSRMDPVSPPAGWISLGSGLEWTVTEKTGDLRIEMRYTHMLNDIPPIDDHRKIGIYQWIGHQWVYAGGEGKDGVVSAVIHEDAPIAVLYNPSRNIVPTDFYLFQNYPNPFNPATTIRFEIPFDSHVKVVVYNLLGQEIAVLFDGYRSQGRYDVLWDGKNARGKEVASGVYLYRLETDKFRLTRKMLLIK